MPGERGWSFPKAQSIPQHLAAWPRPCLGALRGCGGQGCRGLGLAPGLGSSEDICCGLPPLGWWDHSVTFLFAAQWIQEVRGVSMGALGLRAWAPAGSLQPGSPSRYGVTLAPGEPFLGLLSAEWSSKPRWRFPQPSLQSPPPRGQASACPAGQQPTVSPGSCSVAPPTGTVATPVLWFYPCVSPLHPNGFLPGPASISPHWGPSSP